MAITTDLIAGFPGETDAEFAESLQFVEQMEFAGGHVFTYSERPGTAAARMAGSVAHEVRKQRGAILRDVLAHSARQFQKRQVGREVTVLWEATDLVGPQGWRLHGLTDHYLKVTAFAPRRCGTSSAGCN